MPPDCPWGPRGKSCPQTGSLARPGTCQVLPGLWTACWLWTVAAGGGNQSVSIPHLSSSLSFSLSAALSLPLQPPQRKCVFAAIESFMFTGRREGGREETRGEEGGCNPSSKEAQWFLRIKGIKAEKTNKASACSHDHSGITYSRLKLIENLFTYVLLRHLMVLHTMTLLVLDQYHRKNSILVWFFFLAKVSLEIYVTADPNRHSISISTLLKHLELRRPGRTQCFIMLHTLVTAFSPTSERE